MRDYIKVEDLEEGWLYRIKARNADVGIWFPSEQGFVIRRRKFDLIYTFVEIHWDLSPNFGTVKPIERLELSPFEKDDLIYTRQGARYLSMQKEDKILEWLKEAELKYVPDSEYIELEKRSYGNRS